MPDRNISLEEYKNTAYYKKTHRCYNDFVMKGCKKLYSKVKPCMKEHFSKFDG